MTLPKCTVTIFSDASVGADGTVGWGAWVKADGKDGITRQGVLKMKTIDSCTAELCALVNAVHAGIRNGLVRQGDVIMLQCDNLNALGWVLKRVRGAVDNPAKGGLSPVLSRKKKKLNREGAPEIVKAVSLLNATVTDYRIAYQVRHVRGHKKGGGRQFINRTVDKLANKARRAAA